MSDWPGSRLLFDSASYSVYLIPDLQAALQGLLLDSPVRGATQKGLAPPPGGRPAPSVARGQSRRRLRRTLSIGH